MNHYRTLVIVGMRKCCPFVAVTKSASSRESRILGRRCDLPIDQNTKTENKAVSTAD
jgi:hypothetical protein